MVSVHALMEFLITTTYIARKKLMCKKCTLLFLAKQQLKFSYFHFGTY